MNRILLLLFILCTGIRATAQQEPTDSLLNLLNNYPKQDTVRLNLLIDLANAYSETDIAKGIATSNEAIALAKKLNATQKLGKAYFTKALNYVNDEDYNNVLPALSLAIE